MFHSAGPAGSAGGSPPAVREAETALRRLGYSRVAPRARDTAAPAPTFWVQEPGVPRRTYPVILEPSSGELNLTAPPNRPAIFVVGSPARAEELWRRLRAERAPRADPEIAILVLPERDEGAGEPRWHEGVVDRRELLEIATGVIVGLFRRASSEGEGGGQVDFEEMLQMLRQRFHLDLKSTLGSDSDEDALWLMYQLAQRHAYAPGDPSANLHLLVLRPTGPAARLPWFAA